MPLKHLKNMALMSLVFLCSCNGQQSSTQHLPGSNTQTLVGGGCDGCEIMYVGLPKNLTSTDTSIAWEEEGPKLVVAGTVYKADGTTPAPNTIIYYYHTDNTGHYSKRNDRPENQTAHGHIRGWVKSDADGHYAIYTSRPAPYPGKTIPAHIHVMIKEPAFNEYYIDEFVFDNDPLLTKKKRNALENRGGNGILKVTTINNQQVAKHDILLGLNIPNYPVK